jgi:hypothetical protein
LNWQYLIIHHTGAEEKDAEQVRRYHKSLGWRDIGYNFVIERNGLVVPGRSLDQPGAHCLADGMNKKGIGVALIGNLEEHPPWQEQVEALIELMARLMQQHRIPAQNVLGHREVPGAATACPGKYFPLAEVREKVRECLVQTEQRDGAGNGAEHDNDKKSGPGFWIVQAGVFSTRERAENYAQELRERGIDAFVKRDSGK